MGGGNGGIVVSKSIQEYLDEIKIQQYKTDIGFKTLMEGVNDNIYIIPKYQRKYKWKKEQLEALVQSLICDFPIPPIYTYRNKKNQLEILDGQQRVFSLFFYYIGKYIDASKNNSIDYKKLNVTGRSFKEALEDAYILSPLEMKMMTEDDKEIDISYENLSPEVKRMVDYVSLTVIEIRWVNEEKKGETIQQIFKNLNKGGINLEPQEIRDGVYDCKFYDMLHEINDNNPAWRKLWGKESLKGKDMETLLALCAYRKHVAFDGKEFYIENYTGKLANFLDCFSEYVSRIEDEEIIEEYKRSIERFIKQMNVDKVLNRKVTLLISVYIVCEKCNINGVITDQLLDEIKRSKSYKNNTDQGTFAKRKMTERWKGVYEILSKRIK